MMVDATHVGYAVFEFKMSEQESRMPASRNEERVENKSGVMLVSWDFEICSETLSVQSD